MKISKIKLLILIFTIIIIFQDSFTELTGIKVLNYLDEIFILLFAVRAIIHLLKNRVFYSRVNKIFLLICMFWICGIGSCLINSSYSLSSLIMSSILMVKMYLLIMSLIICPLNEKIYTYFIDALLLLGKISAFAGIINFVAPSLWTKIIPYTYEYERLGLPSVMGLFIHAGQYGWFMLLVGIIYYAKYKINKEKKSFYMFVIYAVLACFSMKVKVVVGIVAVLLFDLFFLQKKEISAKKIVIPFIGIGAVILLFGGLISETFQKYFTNSGGSARFAFLSGSLSIIKDFFPFGVGFGKYGTYYAQLNYSEWYYNYGLNTVWGLQPGKVLFGMDTFWPAIMGETGFLGVLVYCIVLLIIFRKIFKNFKYAVSIGNSSTCFSSMFALMIFVQALIETGGEPIFNSSPQNIIIGIFIGGAYAINNDIGKVGC